VHKGSGEQAALILREGERAVLVPEGLRGSGGAYVREQVALQCWRDRGGPCRGGWIKLIWGRGMCIISYRDFMLKRDDRNIPVNEI
jgi:hypothetical protein